MSNFKTVNNLPQMFHEDVNTTMKNKMDMMPNIEVSQYTGSSV